MTYRFKTETGRVKHLNNFKKLNKLESIIESYFDFDIKEKNRERDIVNSRFIFSQIAYKYLKVSKSDIGRFLNKRHDLIIYYLNNFDGILTTDHVFRAIYNEIIGNEIDNIKSIRKVSKATEIEELLTAV